MLVWEAESLRKGIEMAGFDSNFGQLKQNGALPDIDEKHLSPAVRQAIDGLSDDEVQALIRIAKATNSHIALHNKDHRFIIAGL
jgi:hypothetical protein